MAYKLKTTDGRARFLMQAGKDLVANEMSAAAAEAIINNGELRPSKLPNYPICIDGKWWFEGERMKKVKRL